VECFSRRSSSRRSGPVLPRWSARPGSPRFWHSPSRGRRSWSSRSRIGRRGRGSRLRPRGRPMPTESFLAAGLLLAAPILLAALGELVVERAGVLNIGVEGTMLAGAFAAALAAQATDSPGFGALAAAVAGVFVALVFVAAALVLG